MAGTRRARSTRRPALAVLGVVPVGCLITLTMLVAGGSLLWHTSPTLGRKAHAAERNVGAIPGTTTADGPGGRSTAKNVAALAPTRIEIPKLHAVAPIVKVGTTPNRELEIPLNPTVVGWWSPGARPGAKRGTAVFAGHINYAGRTGTLADIGKLSPGDRISIIGRINAKHKGVDQFTVAAVRTYHKTSLPYSKIFDQKTVGRIALVTCGGPFDAATGNYLDNIVVYAVPA